MNPAGRVTETWSTSVRQFPPMLDYNIRDGRTYMYSKEKPLYAFGNGMSYTKFAYSNLRLSRKSVTPDGIVGVTLDVRNTGDRNGDGVVQLYITHICSAVQRPIQELKAFHRVSIQAGTTEKVSFDLPASALAYWDQTHHAFRVESDRVEVRVGAASDDIRVKGAFSILGTVQHGANSAAHAGS